MKEKLLACCLTIFMLFGVGRVVAQAQTTSINAAPVLSGSIGAWQLVIDWVYGYISPSTTPNASDAASASKDDQCPFRICGDDPGNP